MSKVPLVAVYTLITLLSRRSTHSFLKPLLDFVTREVGVGRNVVWKSCVRVSLFRPRECPAWTSYPVVVGQRYCSYSWGDCCGRRCPYLKSFRCTKCVSCSNHSLRTLNDLLVWINRTLVVRFLLLTPANFQSELNVLMFAKERTRGGWAGMTNSLLSCPPDLRHTESTVASFNC